VEEWAWWIDIDNAVSVDQIIPRVQLPGRVRVIAASAPWPERSWQGQELAACAAPTADDAAGKEDTATQYCLLGAPWR
jgi:hypothetical protein